MQVYGCSLFQLPSAAAVAAVITFISCDWLIDQSLIGNTDSVQQTRTRLTCQVSLILSETLSLWCGLTDKIQRFKYYFQGCSHFTKCTCFWTGNRPRVKFLHYNLDWKIWRAHRTNYTQQNKRWKTHADLWQISYMLMTYNCNLGAHAW